MVYLRISGPFKMAVYGHGFGRGDQARKDWKLDERCVDVVAACVSRSVQDHRALGTALVYLEVEREREREE